MSTLQRELARVRVLRGSPGTVTMAVLTRSRELRLGMRWILSLRVIRLVAARASGAQTLVAIALVAICATCRRVGIAQWEARGMRESSGPPSLCTVALLTGRLVAHECVLGILRLLVVRHMARRTLTRGASKTIALVARVTTLACMCKGEGEALLVLVLGGSPSAFIVAIRAVRTKAGKGMLGIASLRVVRLVTIHAAGTEPSETVPLVTVRALKGGVRPDQGEGIRVHGLRRAP